MQGHGDPSFLHGDTSWSEEGGVEAKADDSTQAELGRDCSLRFLRHHGGRFWEGQSRERLCGEREPQECAQAPLGLWLKTWLRRHREIPPHQWDQEQSWGKSRQRGA